MLNHPLFLTIKEEHQNIIQLSEDFLNDKDNSSQLIKIISDHHYKEETLLFSELKKNPQLSQGGPLCTYFYDEQIISPPLELAKSITGEAAEALDYQKQIAECKTPILIPLNEHRAIQSILNYFLNNKAKGLGNKKSDLSKLFQLISSNRQKEENCLFHVCIRLLDHTQLDSIYDLWRN